MKQTTKNRIINWASWARGGSARSNDSMTGFICDRMRAASMGALGSCSAGMNFETHRGRVRGVA